MALVECPDCGKRISDQATECNQCGRPMPTPRGKAEESSGHPDSPDDQSTNAAKMRSQLPEDLSTAVGAIGAGAGIVVMVLYSLATGLVLVGLAVAAGLWIHYRSH